MNDKREEMQCKCDKNPVVITHYSLRWENDHGKEMKHLIYELFGIEPNVGNSCPLELKPVGLGPICSTPQFIDRQLD